MFVRKKFDAPIPGADRAELPRRQKGAPEDHPPCRHRARRRPADKADGARRVHQGRSQTAVQCAAGAVHAQAIDLLSQCRRNRKAAHLGVDLGQCREQNRLNIGVREALLYSSMGWDRLLGSRKASANRIIKELVLARIAQPRSKRGTVMDLATDGGVTLNLDWVYQSMDYLTRG